MRRVVYVLLGLLAAVALAAGSWAGESVATRPAIVVPDSRTMQKALQQLPWPQFRAIIEAVPKLKADVDAYGPAGWQLVKDNYRLYPWKKSIDKLDDEQKRQLATLIGRAATAR